MSERRAFWVQLVVVALLSAVTGLIVAPQFGKPGTKIEARR